jgi:hypothetical protein
MKTGSSNTRRPALASAKLALGAVALLSGIAEGCSKNNGGSTDVVGNVQSIVFVKRNNYAPDGTPDVSGGTGQVIDYLRYQPGGGVYTLSPPRPDGKLVNITQAYPQADVNGLDVSFDAKSVVFTMRRNPDDAHYHVYTATVDPGPAGDFNIKQLTFGARDDVMPIFIPGDRIAFVTNEPYTPMGTRADEYEHAAVVSQLATISLSGGDADRHVCAQNLSHTVNVFLRYDGTIGYSRWEHLGDTNDVKAFRMNPDCSQMVALLGQHNKPFNSYTQLHEIAPNKYIGVASPRNRTLQAGALVLADVTSGGEEGATFNNITPGVQTGGGPSPVGRYRTPNVLPDGRFLVSYANSGVSDQDELTQTPPNFGVYVYDPTSQQNILVYNDAKYMSLYAAPLVARNTPPVIGDIKRATPGNYDPGIIGSVDITQTSLNETIGGLDGASLKGLSLADALKQAVAVRVIEGFSSEIGSAPMFGLTMHEGAAILGEATIYNDGSWQAQIPSYLPVHLQPIDKFGMAIRNQRLWIQTNPTEERRCGGCHESRTGTVVPRRGSGLTLAQEKGPQSFAVPIAQRSEYGWDVVVQPILDSACKSCHTGGASDPYAGQTYTVTATDQTTGKKTQYVIPYLYLGGEPQTVAYDMGYYQWTKSYVSLYYPYTLRTMSRGLTYTGKLPPNWMVPASARDSVVIQTLNPQAPDGTLAWAGLTQHAKDKGFTLTNDQVLTLIKAADLGGQFTSRQNVKSSTCWKNADGSAEQGKCGNGAGAAGGTVYP